MRGWFDLVSGYCPGPNPPPCRGFAKKRLMGFEPTTFCMAITEVSGTHSAQTSCFAGLL
jgi:hypothetical protein